MGIKRKPVMERADETDYDAIINATPPSIQSFGDALRQAARFGNVEQVSHCDCSTLSLGMLPVHAVDRLGDTSLRPPEYKLARERGVFSSRLRSCQRPCRHRACAGTAGRQSVIQHSRCLFGNDTTPMGSTCR